VDYADHRCVDRAVLTVEGHPGRAALHYEHDFIDAGSYGIDRDKVTLLVPALNVHHPGDQQLAAVKSVVLPCCDDRSNYSSKNHKWYCPKPGQRSVSRHGKPTP